MMNQGSPYAARHPKLQTASRAEMPPSTSSQARKPKKAMATTPTLNAAKGALFGIMAMLATSCTITEASGQYVKKQNSWFLPQTDAWREVIYKNMCYSSFLLSFLSKGGACLRGRHQLQQMSRTFHFDIPVGMYESVLYHGMTNDIICCATANRSPIDLAFATSSSFISPHAIAITPCYLCKGGKSLRLYVR